MARPVADVGTGGLGQHRHDLPLLAAGVAAGPDADQPHHHRLGQLRQQGRAARACARQACAAVRLEDFQRGVESVHLVQGQP